MVEKRSNGNLVGSVHRTSGRTAATQTIVSDVERRIFHAIDLAESQRRMRRKVERISRTMCPFGKKSA